MGGPACWKNIIDQLNALNQVCGCMAESIRIAGVNGVYPTDDDEKEFREAAEALAVIAGRIQASVNGG